ncbi:zinc finger protein 184-like [Calliphora vicina]|uniref:zinc finger protein 184-like n=1 Tax=Calliphora vicina TaxID=7373 RepID=UPI00325A990B
MASTTSCRLCSFTCEEFKCLYDDNGQESAVYQIAVKYFNPSLLNSGTDTTLRVICLECWQHISDFHSFHQWILNAQAQQEDMELIVHEEKSDEQISTFDVIEFDLIDDTSTSKSSHSTKSISSPINSIESEDENYNDSITKLRRKLECYKCKDIFESFANLDAHFQQFHPIDQFYVICCNEKFYQRWNLFEHFLGFHKQKDVNPFKCEQCGASFSQYGNLRRHVRRKHTVQPLLKWICKYCNKMFKNRSNLERHKNKIHTSQLNNDLQHENKIDEEEYLDSFEIDYEPEEDIQVDAVYETNDISNLNKYESILNAFPLESSEVNKDLQSLKQVSYSNDIYIKEESDIEFDITSSSTDINATKQIHMPALDIVDIKNENSTDTESEGDTKKFKKNVKTNEFNSDLEKGYDDFIDKWKGDLECPKCNKHVISYQQLSEHFALEHPEERCYINCCHITLYERTSIVEHLRFHENPNAFECSDCGKCFKNSKGLGSHKLQVHSDNRSAYHLHLCYCKRAKELHAENKAKGQQIEYDTVVCCQRKKKILEDDALIAGWKKDLTCEICKESFSYYSLMRAHFYHKHPGEKCYILCCHRKISRISDALEHIRSHLDPQAYRCKICNITFSGKSTLAKHMRNVHMDSIPKHKWACNKCDKTFEIRQILTRHQNVYHSQ